MKKIIALCVAFAFVGCGQESEQPTKMPNLEKQIEEAKTPASSTEEAPIKVDIQIDQE
jgi:hypothetical protein